MSLRYRNVFPLVVVCLALAVAPAFAAKPSPTLVPLPEGSFLPTTDINAAASVCNLGQVGPAVAAQGPWFFPSDDYYYTLFNPAACGCAGGLTNLVAHWTLFWPQPCFIFGQVWIVPAVETSAGSGCYIPAPPNSPPDPTNILCGPSNVVMLEGSAGGLIDHAVALPPCPCIANGQRAFVLFKIVTPGSCPVSGGALDSPIVAVDGSPDACVSYNAFTGSGGGVDMLSFGFSGNMVMSVEADCCQPTPTLPGTWGMLKTLYR